MANMDAASNRTNAAMQEMQRGAQIASAALASFGVAGAGAFAIMVRNTIDAADHLKDMAQKTGIAVETLNGLGFAAGQAGGNLDSMVAAAGKLNKSIAESAGGNKESQEAFKALGISVIDAAGNLKKADVVMSEVADKFEGFEDGPEKSAIALRLFGKAGADMIPLLNEGGGAMRENIEYTKKYSGMTSQLAAASDEFNDTLGRLTVQQQAFSNQLTAAVLPMLKAVADETLRASEESEGFSGVIGGVRNVLQTVIVMGSETAFVLKGVGNEIGGLIAQVGALGVSWVDVATGPVAVGAAMAKAAVTGEGSFRKFKAIGAEMRADAEKARKDQDAFIAKIMNPISPVMDDGEATRRKGRGPAPRLAGGSAVKDPDADFKAYLKNLQNQIQKTQELTAVEKLLADLRDSENLTVTAAQQVRLMGFAKEIDRQKEQVEVLKIKRDLVIAEGDAVIKANEEFQRQAAQNAANVENIRFSLMTEVEQENFVHEKRLEDLQKFHDARLENVTQANADIERENARHEQAKRDIQAANEMQSLAMFGNAADQLYGLMQKAGKEQSALGKAAFLASKAIAVAEIILNTEVAAAKAGAQLGIFGLPMATIIRVTGYASAGMVAGMAIADASAEGGYDIPAGVNPMTQLHEREMVLPKEQADVVRGLARNGGGDAMKLTIVNNTSAPIGRVTEQRISPTERALIIEEAVGATAAQFSDPNSKTSRALSRNYATQRSR